VVTPRRQLGDRGEELAAQRLLGAGLAIVERNVRVASGEIDIVAREEEDLVFVEVRTRRAAPGLAAESIGPAKLQRMWRCAMEYCEAEGLDADRARLDLVSVDLPGARGGKPLIEHFRGLEVPGDD
jgi:putative endonuclease